MPTTISLLKVHLQIFSRQRNGDTVPGGLFHNQFLGSYQCGALTHIVYPGNALYEFRGGKGSRNRLQFLCGDGQVFSQLLDFCVCQTQTADVLFCFCCQVCFAQFSNTEGCLQALDDVAFCDSIVLASSLFYTVVVFVGQQLANCSSLS